MVNQIINWASLKTRKFEVGSYTN